MKNTNKQLRFSAWFFALLLSTILLTAFNIDYSNNRAAAADPYGTG